MQREKLKQYPYLWKCYPIFFWQECDFCNKEFRREKGWRAYVESWRLGRYDEIHICHTCAPCRRVAEKLINDKIFGTLPVPKHPRPPKGGTGETSCKNEKENYK